MIGSFCCFSTKKIQINKRTTTGYTSDTESFALPIDEFDYIEYGSNFPYPKIDITETSFIDYEEGFIIPIPEIINSFLVTEAYFMTGAVKNGFYVCLHYLYETVTEIEYLLVDLEFCENENA